MNSTVSPLLATQRTVPLNTFAPDELFFSITDSRGLIEHANSVFTRLSGYTFEEMQTQPHSIVRDPAMPRGAFRLIWDEITAGRPVASYVANRSRNGSRYEVFAVMLPTDGGYISMRLRPEEGGMRDMIFELFDRAREVEAAVEGGARAQADAGAAFILAELAKLGIPDMATLTKRTLPREVMSTVEAVAELEHSAGREPLEILPGKIRMLGRLMMSPLRSLEAVDQASFQLYAAVAGDDARSQTLAHAEQTVQEVTDALAWSGADTVGGGKELAEAAAAARDELRRARLGVNQSLDQAAQLRDAVELLAQNIGVFALQNQMIGRFAVELLGGSVAEPPGSSMRLLHQTLAERLDAVTAGISEVNRLAATTPEVVARTSGLLDTVAAPLLQWAGLAERVLSGQGAEAAPNTTDRVRAIRTAAQHGFGWGDSVSQLVAELGRVDVKIEEMPINATVKFIGIVAADIA